MALGSSRRLLVPAADVLAKNKRALDAARVSPDAAAMDAGGAPSGKRLALIGLGAATEDNNREAQTNVRFRRAPDDEPSSPLATLWAKLFPKKLSDEEKEAEEERRKTQKSGVQKAWEKALPMLEKAAALVSRLPDPTILFLALVLCVLLLERMRPHWMRPLIVKLAAISSFGPLFVLALLWRKTELFATMREGQNPLSHPAEHRLDGLEANLKEREERVKSAQETLAKNRAQLDALRKELAKDPNARDPDAVIVPSRKAAAMIRAGALGAGYDEQAAQAVENRRREESVQRSRQEWRVRTEETDGDVAQTNESVKLMKDHAATVYTKRTREMKSKVSTGQSKNTERLLNLRKSTNARMEEASEEANRRMSRQSERSATASTATSTGRKPKRGIFRRRRRGEGSGEAAPSPTSSRTLGDGADVVQL